MDELGVDVVPWADGLQAGLPRAFTRLLEKEPYGEYDAVLQFAPPYDIRPWRLRQAERRFGWTMWERTPMLDSDFVDDPEWGERRWDGMTRMFVTCPMNVGAERQRHDSVVLRLTLPKLRVARCVGE